MNKIRLSGSPDLTLVFAGGKEICPPQEVQIGLWMVSPYFFDDIFDAYHVLKRGLARTL
jgi:hypothetical protein